MVNPQLDRPPSAPVVPSHVLVSRLSRRIPESSDPSFALVSTSANVDCAAVFVHGFGGHPDKTWRSFPDLIRTDPRWANTDAYFFAYSSIDDEISLSADYLRSFISSVAPQPPAAIYEITAQRGLISIRDFPGEYSRLKLIGHSEGGVVIRTAVLEAVKRCAASPSATAFCDELLALAEVSLFAPAIAGARLAGNLGRVLNTVGVRAAWRTFNGGSPACQELEPTSTLLRTLREDTTHFAEATAGMPALKARIIWAHRDEIVSSIPYRHDVSWRSLRTTHSTVCKPSSHSDPCYELANGQAPTSGVL